MIFYLRDTEETVFFSFEVMTSLSAFVMRVNHIINNSSATTSSILKNFHGSEFRFGTIQNVQSWPPTERMSDKTKPSMVC